MNILKKTLMAGMAATVLTGAGATIAAPEAEAHYRYYGHHHKHHYKKRYYKRHYVKCWHKWVWRTDYYGYQYKKKIRVCR